MICGSSRRGFTLIELLVVVLIIGILAAIALPQYQKAVMKSRYVSLMPMVDTLANAEELYYMAHGNYTDNFEELDLQPSGCVLSNDKKRCSFDWGSCTLDTSVDYSVACVNNTLLKNGYARYFQQNSWGSRQGYTRVCWALSSEDKYGKVCEQIGGKKKHAYGKAACPPHGACAIYALD